MESSISQARGYLELGMTTDAWNALEELDPASPLRTSAEVIELRIKILEAAGKPDKAQFFASL